jgi:hypothetical protein
MMMFQPNLDPVNTDFLIGSFKLKSEKVRNQIDEVVGFSYTFQFSTGEWYRKVCDLNHNTYYYEDSYKRVVEKKR